MSDDEELIAKPNPTDRIYDITNIKSYVPLLLDLDRLNYDSWKELFKTQCLGYSVYHHLTGADSDSDDPEWVTVDNIVKQWIYCTLTQIVFQSVLKPDSTAASVWKTIEDLFHENKETKAMELDDELRSLIIGDSYIIDYCNKIKSISDLLTNIGSPVSERNLVIYVINGLSKKYAHIVTTIRHTKPFPTFIEMRSMLTLEERTMLKEQTRLIQPTHHDNSSSPTVLNIEHQSQTQNAGRGSQNSGRGGGRGRSNNQQHGAWGGAIPWLVYYPVQQQRGIISAPPWPAFSGPRQQQPQWPTSGSTQQLWTQPLTTQQQAFLASGQPNCTPNTWPFFQYPDQATTLPQAFNTMNFQDPENADWYMDISATAHLHNDTGHLHFTVRVFNDGFGISHFFWVLLSLETNTACFSLNRNTPPRSLSVLKCLIVSPLEPQQILRPSSMALALLSLTLRFIVAWLGHFST